MKVFPAVIGEKKGKLQPFCICCWWDGVLQAPKPQRHLPCGEEPISQLKY